MAAVGVCGERRVLLQFSTQRLSTQRPFRVLERKPGVLGALGVWAFWYAVRQLARAGFRTSTDLDDTTTVRSMNTLSNNRPSQDSHSLRINSITKRFGDAPVLKGISLDVFPGEFLTLVGPSGCGKTTLLRIIAGLESQDSGEIHIGNRCVDNVRAKDRNVAMVFQSYALYPHLNVFDNMALPLRMRALKFRERLPFVARFVPGARSKEADITTQVKSVARALEIEPLLHRKPSQLSGGQRQRVAVGRAVVREPLAFLMDEPLSNLDATLRIKMRAELAQLHRLLEATFIFVTHDQAEAMTMSDRVAIMMDGEIIQVGPPGSLYSNPADVRVAKFLGSPQINVIPATVASTDSVEILGHRHSIAVDLPSGSPISVGIRPEGFDMRDGDDTRGFTGRMQHIEHLGSEILVHLRLEGLSETVRVRLPPKDFEGIKLHDELTVCPRFEDILIFGADGQRVPVVTAK